LTLGYGNVQSCQRYYDNVARRKEKKKRKEKGDDLQAN
jgi:hypothetical protein